MKRAVFEVEADEVALSLKFASAKVTKVSRSRADVPGNVRQGDISRSRDPDRGPATPLVATQTRFLSNENRVTDPCRRERPKRLGRCSRYRFRGLKGVAGKAAYLVILPEYPARPLPARYGVPALCRPGERAPA